MQLTASIKRDLRAACPSALEHLPYEFQAGKTGWSIRGAARQFQPTADVHFPEANPTMVLTALQSESQANKGGVKFKMQCVGSTPPPRMAIFRHYQDDMKHF